MYTPGVLLSLPSLTRSEIPRSRFDNGKIELSLHLHQEYREFHALREESRSSSPSAVPLSLQICTSLEATGAPLSAQKMLSEVPPTRRRAGDSPARPLHGNKGATNDARDRYPTRPPQHAIARAAPGRSPARRVVARPRGGGASPLQKRGSRQAPSLAVLPSISTRQAMRPASIT